MNRIMQYFKQLVLIAGCCLVGLFTACEEDELVTTPLDTPSISAGAATVSTLTFSWEKVANVSQYAYELKDPEGELVKGDVITTNTVSFNGLKAKTTYTLDVWAYGAMNSTYGTSPVASLTASTTDYIGLEKPNPIVEVSGGTVTITWDPVPHADYYIYYYTNEQGEESELFKTSDTSVSLGLESGTYELCMSAHSNDVNYVTNQEAKLSITVTKREQYRAQGTFTYGENSWESTIVSYGNGEYSILNWHGTEGYDMDFTLAEDGTAEFSSAYESDDWYFYIPMSADYTAYAYKGYSSWEKEDDKMTFYFYEYYVGDYCSFTWTEAQQPALTVDQLVGSYKEVASGYDYSIWGWGTTDYSFAYDDNTVTISKVDETTVKLLGFYWCSEELVGTVDVSARTITFQPQTLGSYYTFAQETDEQAPVVATIAEDGTIQIKGWGAWYGGYTYIEGAQTQLSKQ